MLSHLFICRSCFSNTSPSCLQLTKLQDILFKGSGQESIVSDWKARRERFYPLLDTLTPVLGFLVLFLDRLDLTVLLVMYSSWQFERNLTMFPKVKLINFNL